MFKSYFKPSALMTEADENVVDSTMEKQKAAGPKRFEFWIVTVETGETPPPKTAVQKSSVVVAANASEAKEKMMTTLKSKYGSNPNITAHITHTVEVT